MLAIAAFGVARGPLGWLLGFLAAAFLASPAWTLAIAAIKFKRSGASPESRGNLLFHLLLAIPFFTPFAVRNEDLIGPQVLVVLASSTLSLWLFFASTLREPRPSDSDAKGTT